MSLTLTGRLARADFCGPVWVLETPDESYELRGLPDSAQEGQRIEVEARRAEEAMGMNMVGPILEVVRWRYLKA